MCEEFPTRIVYLLIEQPIPQLDIILQSIITIT